MSRDIMEKFKMVGVDSSTIQAVGYLPSERKLRIDFVNGGSYLYANVEGNRHRAFMEAESKGKYAHKHIIGNQKYKCTKILSEKVNLTDTQTKSFRQFSREKLTRDKILSAIQAKEFPLTAALVQTKVRIQNGQAFPYSLWVACGKEDTKIMGPAKETRYARCLQLMMEAAGEIGKEHIDATIVLARKKKV